MITCKWASGGGGVVALKLLHCLGFGYKKPSKAVSSFVGGGGQSKATLITDEMKTLLSESRMKNVEGE